MTGSKNRWPKNTTRKLYPCEYLVVVNAGPQSKLNNHVVYTKRKRLAHTIQHILNAPLYFVLLKQLPGHWAKCSYICRPSGCNNQYTLAWLIDICVTRFLSSTRETKCQLKILTELLPAAKNKQLMSSNFKSQKKYWEGMKSQEAGEDGDYAEHYTVTITMTPAFTWAEIRVILMLH